MLALAVLAAGVVASLDAAIRAFLADHEVPAAHVTLLRGDQIILQRGYGSSDAAGTAPGADSIFPVGSISKQFTAAAILALADAGKLRLVASRPALAGPTATPTTRRLR